MANENPQAKCPKCQGILDPNTGECPWCKKPAETVPREEGGSEWERPSWLVISLGILALVPFIVTLFIETPTVTGQEALNVMWVKNMLRAVGVFFAVIAIRLYLKQKGDL